MIDLASPSDGPIGLIAAERYGLTEYAEAEGALQGAGGTIGGLSVVSAFGDGVLVRRVRFILSTALWS